MVQLVLHVNTCALVGLTKYTLTYTHPTLLPCSKGEALQHFVVVQLVQLLCRTVKLGWYDNESQRSIVDDCKLLLEKNSPAHYILGLRILNNLVTVSGWSTHLIMCGCVFLPKIYTPTPGRTLTQHRNVVIG